MVVWKTVAAISFISAGTAMTTNAQGLVDSKPHEQRFEVISIKRSAPGDSFAIRPNPDNFVALNVTLKYLIGYSYDVHDFQIDDAAGWQSSMHFDIHAKSEVQKQDESRTLKEERIKEEIRSMLTERFALVVREGTKKTDVYSLHQLKTKNKLLPAEKNTGYSSGMGQIKCTSSSMQHLATLLSEILDMFVVDQTSLQGQYQFDLRWSNQAVASSETDLPDIATALKEQLGLGLTRTPGVVKSLAVVSASVPTEN